MHGEDGIMKKVLFVAVILTLISALFIGVGPALAEITGNTTTVKPPVTATEGTYRGIVKAVSPTIITIGSTNVTIVLETRYEVPGIKSATLADISVGMNVTAQTQKINGQPYAIRISVVPLLRNFEGNVTAYSYNASVGGSISIKDNSGKVSSFSIGADEFSIQPLGVVVKTGDHVNVTTRRLKDGDVPVAIGVNVSILVEHYSGNVTAFNYNLSTGGNITVMDGGKTITFAILANKFTIRPEGAIVKVGSHVTVTIQTPPGAPQRVATGVEVVIVTQSFAGNVTGYSYDPAKGGNIAITGREGKKQNFVIEAGNLTIQPKDAVIDVGDIVTVTAKVLDGGQLVVVRVEVQPKPVTIKGIITNVDQVKKTITIGTTVVSYDDRTTFTLHRTLSVTVGLQATVTGYEQPNNIILAGSISVEPVAVPVSK
jgi:hypothetical protein